MVFSSKELHCKHALVSTLFIIFWTLCIGLDDTLRKIMLLYFIIDFILFHKMTTMEMCFHHIVAFLMIYFYWNHVETKQLVLTEVSTPFLVMFQLNIFKNFSKILFILTFFYFRIFHMGLILIRHRYETNDPCVWLFFMLFLLNCYWAEIIIRKKFVRVYLQNSLQKITPYSHFLSWFVLLYNDNTIYTKTFLLLSPITSYLWHKTKYYWFYILDLMCLHALSFFISFQHVGSGLVFLSLPFHIADYFFYYAHHRLWVMLSIGWDMMLVFLYYKRDFVWLWGWFITALFNTRQTFGYGPTQSIVHICIATLLYNLRYRTNNGGVLC